MWKLRDSRNRPHPMERLIAEGKFQQRWKGFECLRNCCYCCACLVSKNKRRLRKKNTVAKKILLAQIKTSGKPCRKFSIFWFFMMFTLIKENLTRVIKMMTFLISFRLGFFSRRYFEFAWFFIWLAYDFGENS